MPQIVHADRWCAGFVDESAEQLADPVGVVRTIDLDDRTIAGSAGTLWMT